MTLYIHATNIHSGGGAELLRALLESGLAKGSVVQVDTRFEYSHGDYEGVTIRKINASIIDRFRAERWLARTCNEYDVVLCFGNLPPLFRCKALVNVFLHNLYLISTVPLGGFPLPARLRLMAERLWFRWRIPDRGRYIVQTPTTRRQFAWWLNHLAPLTATRTPVVVMPFLRGGVELLSQRANSGRDQFVYVASGEAHKNHSCLFKAWLQLAEEGIFPTLHITLHQSSFPELCHDVAELKEKHGVKIINHGWITRQEVDSLYDQCDALIYPSLLESFGLPLIEARRRGLPIVAAELDYVRDVVEPTETFDANSPVSIARAVRRFLNLSDSPVAISDADDFLRQIQQDVA
ncbi:MAG TPA: glycosyltransferase [Ensifer sp.]|nr:glycosyltransferase [Ensifer sp.]